MLINNEVISKIDWEINKYPLTLMMEVAVSTAID